MRVTTLATQTQLLNHVIKTQVRIADQNIAITSGKSATRYSGVAEDSKRLVNLEAAHVQMTRYVDNIQVADQRLQSTETAMSQLISAANNFRTDLVGALNSDNAAVSGINVQAANMLQEVATILNRDFNGIHLFAGSMTDTAPVDLNDVDWPSPPATYPSVADFDYYQGDQGTLSLRADTDLTINYGIRADEAAVEKLLRGLKLAETATVSPVPDKARLGEALRIMEEAVNELPLLMSSIGAARQSLETASVSHNETLLYTEQAITDISSTDLTEAITLLNQDRSTLEASFAAMAQLSNLSLLNFL